MKEGTEGEKEKIEIHVKEDVDFDKLLTKEDKVILLSGMESKNSVVDAAFYHMCQMLTRWREPC